RSCEGLFKALSGTGEQPKLKYRFISGKYERRWWPVSMVTFFPGRRTSGENDDGRDIHSSKITVCRRKTVIVERRLFK
ncbi:MAG: hypothetical protein PHU54_05595, partial [Candidatus Omnitrophica bacterium]|nr:hypothetical protein [Candidatus Omnitrophota bacterium]